MRGRGPEEGPKLSRSGQRHIDALWPRKFNRGPYVARSTYLTPNAADRTRPLTTRWLPALPPVPMTTIVPRLPRAPRSSRLTSKTHKEDGDQIVFATIKPRWYPNLVESAREGRYGHRDGCL